MYRPREFAVDDPEALARVMRENSFALLASAAGGALLASHIPLLVETAADRPASLLGHVARANPHWQAFDAETEAMTVFGGTHAYVSPAWYASPGLVPTWNYAVHAYGKPRIIADPEAVAGLVRRLVDAHERDRTDPWSLDRLPAGSLDRQMKGIVAFEMPIERLEGKFKLSENRTAEDRAGVIAGLRASADPMAHEVARLMGEHPGN